MKIPGRIVSVLLIVSLGTIQAFPQQYCRVTNYGRDVYGAGNQNWSIDSDKEGYVYAANNNGLLVYDGAHWKLLQHPGQSIVRSVHVSRDNRIYVGSFEEFGYWQRKPDGSYGYTSLKPLLQKFSLHNSEIWKIVESGNSIYFQSFSSLFVYSGNKIRSIPTPGNIVLLLKAGNRIFLQAVAGRLYELVGDRLIAIPGSEVLSGTEVKTILPFSNTEFLIGTASEGVYLFNGRSFTAWNVPANAELKLNQINNGVIAGNRIIFGTIVKGIYVLDRTGNILQHYHTGNDLPNNTVLSLSNKGEKSIWAGLDMGLSNITFDFPIDIYRETNTPLGAVYAAALSGNELYIGTNRGVFNYSFQSGKFHYGGLINGSQGQVWDIRNIDGELLCGHTNGTFRMSQSGFDRVSAVSGGYNLRKIQSGGQEYLIQSTYTSLVIYKKIGGQWVFSHQVEGFIEPARFLETDHLGNIWIGHLVKGLYKLRLNDRLDSVISLKQYGKADGLPSDYGIRVFKLANRVIFLTGESIYTWDDLHQKIIPFTSLNQQLQGFQQAGTIVAAGNDHYWLLKGDEAGLFRLREDKAELRYRLMLPLFQVHPVDQYENLIVLNDTLHLLCLENGFALLNPNRLLMGFSDASKLIWSGITCFDSQDHETVLDPEVKNIKLSSSRNNIEFSFSVINSPGISHLFQYKLEGLDRDWSNWTSKPEMHYTRLPAGRYRFQVRTMTINGTVSDPLSFDFRVRPPWYGTLLAFTGYAILGIFLLLILLRASRKRVEQKHEQLRKQEEARREMEKQQSEQEIMTLTNANLQAEISHKNLQLANSTMAIIRKNEALIGIRDELVAQKEMLGNRYPARYLDKINSLIDRNLSNDNDWKVFEALFDQAHENFFKRLKQRYPELTQSDLKLCAYLKLNLTSKEIAPLLNITYRGVEIRRYRLRKRLSLPPEENLVNFIMQF